MMMASFLSKMPSSGVAAHLVERTLAAGEHAQDALHAAHLLDGLHLVEHVIHGEALAQHALGSLELLGVGRLPGLLNNADNVAHTQNALGHTIGIERLQRIGLPPMLTNLMGLPVTWRTESAPAATGIAVELEMITPSKSVRSAKVETTLTISPPVMASTTIST